MKTLENLILKACGYTASILFLFYLAGTIADFTNPSIDFKTFLFISLFGALISVASFILKIEKIHYFLRLLIHYAVLFCAFTVIFIISGNISGNGAAAIFSALIIFTFFYAIIFSAIFFISKAVKKVDSKIDKRFASLTKKPKKSEYKNLYKKED